MTNDDIYAIQTSLTDGAACMRAAMIELTRCKQFALAEELLNTLRRVALVTEHSSLQAKAEPLELNEAEESLLREGLKIEAIRSHRHRTQSTLKDSKEIVDEWLASHVVPEGEGA